MAWNSLTIQCCFVSRYLQEGSPLPWTPLPATLSHTLGLLLTAALGSSQKPGPWPAVQTLPAWQGGMDFSGFLFCLLLPRAGWRGATSLKLILRGWFAGLFHTLLGQKSSLYNRQEGAVRLYLLHRARTLGGGWAGGKWWGEERKGDRGRPGTHVVLGERSAGCPCVYWRGSISLGIVKNWFFSSFSGL